MGTDRGTGQADLEILVVDDLGPVYVDGVKRILRTPNELYVSHNGVWELIAGGIGQGLEVEELGQIAIATDITVDGFPNTSPVVTQPKLPVTDPSGGWLVDGLTGYLIVV